MTSNFFSPLSFVAFLDPGSGMGKNQDTGSEIGINIPDPQHCRNRLNPNLSPLSYELLRKVYIFIMDVNTVLWIRNFLPLRIRNKIRIRILIWIRIQKKLIDTYSSLSLIFSFSLFSYHN